MKTILLVILLGFAVLPAIYGQTNSWQGITPLLSTRAEVEKLLGKPVKGVYYGESNYTTDKGRFTVTYALKSCDAGWDVPIDTVLSIEIPPPDGQLNKSAEELKLEQSKFFVSGDDAFYGTWTDPESGVQRYFGMMNQNLIWIKYVPTRADNARRCNGFPPFVPEAQYYALEARSFNNPKAGKDGGMNDLLNSLFNVIYRAKVNKGMYKPYVLVYFDEKLPYKAYQKRLRQFRIYAERIVKRAGQPIEIIEAGINYENEAVFYLVPGERKPPAPTPMLPSPRFMTKKK